MTLAYIPSVLLKTLVHLNWWTVFVIVVALAWIWWRKPHSRFPPGPRGVPVLGVLPFLGSHPERTFKKWSLEKYGPVMSVRIANEDLIVLNSFEFINQALVRQGNVFSGRPILGLFLQTLGRTGIALLDYNEKFKTQKRFGIAALKNLGMGKKQMENIINEETDHFVEFHKSSLNKPIYISRKLHSLGGNVISMISLNQRFDYDAAGSNNTSIFKMLHDTYSDPKDAYKIAVLFLFHKYTKYIPPFSNTNKRIIKTETDIAAFLRPLIEEHKKTFDKNDIRDFVDAFLYEQQYRNGKNDLGFSDRQLCVYLRDLFMAGTETTSTTINWAILSLLHYPKYHHNIVEEIDQVIGPQQQPSLSVKSEMPITCAFIQEVYRFLPVAPISLQHQTQADTDLCGYFIPKGTKVIPNTWGAHFDPETWKNPFEFNPHRHINDEGRFVPSTKIIPFGIGPRYCLGENLARAEIFLVLTKLLQKFVIRSSDEPLPKLMNGIMSIVYSPKQYEVVLSVR